MKILVIWKYIFGDWTKWEDVGCSESLGWVSVIQTRTETRTERRTGKKQIRTSKVWVNDIDSYNEMRDIILKTLH